MKNSMVKCDCTMGKNTPNDEITTLRRFFIMDEKKVNSTENNNKNIGAEKATAPKKENDNKKKIRISEECHYAFEFSFFCLNAIGDIPRYFFVNLHRKEELGKSKTEHISFTDKVVLSK